MATLKNIVLEYFPTVKGWTFTSFFGARGSGTHSGIDIANPSGGAIFSTAEGRVSKVASDEDGYGNYIIIDHGNYSTLYAHLKELPKFAKGAFIGAGQTIGQMGSTGKSTGTHLHFEIRQNDGSDYWSSTKINPIQYIKNLASPQKSQADYYTSFSGRPSDMSIFTDENGMPTTDISELSSGAWQSMSITESIGAIFTSITNFFKGLKNIFLWVLIIIVTMVGVTSIVKIQKARKG